MKSKFIARVSACKDKLVLESLKDNRTGEFKDKEYIKSRGVQDFLDYNDMVETLNWNLNGRTKACRVNVRHAGYTVYIYD